MDRRIGGYRRVVRVRSDVRAGGIAAAQPRGVLSKVLFLTVIVEVHRAIFDPQARTERRLDELRRLMAAVWESSSDVIAISVRLSGTEGKEGGGGGGGASCMLSTALFSLGSGDGPLRNLTNEQIKDLFQRKSVL